MDYRIKQLEKAFEQVVETLKGIERTLAQFADTKSALERAFTRLREMDGKLDGLERSLPDRLGERLGTIEKDLPILNLTSSWVKTGVLGVLGLVGAIAIKIIFGG